MVIILSLPNGEKLSKTAVYDRTYLTWKGKGEKNDDRFLAKKRDDELQRNLMQSYAVFDGRNDHPEILNN